MSDVLKSLFVLGSTHNEAPLAIREDIALTSEQVSALQQELHSLDAIKESLVVNTCNRLEVYGLADTLDIEDTVRDCVCKYNGVSRKLLDAHSFWRTNLDVLQHAFEVSAGLDSQMIGETDILGQMKQAYAHARKTHCTGTILNRLFEKSFQAAKSVRTKTRIAQGQVSIGNITVDLGNRIFGNLSNSRVLLVGSGDVAEKTAQSLKSRGVADITVTSRTFENAHVLAHKFGGAAIEFSDFEAQLKRFDIVISSTTAPGTIIDRNVIKSALKKRPDQPFFLIDLALPRDIDPNVDMLENVYLYNLDDLSAIANENIEMRKAEISQARTILKAHAWNIWLQLRRRTLAIPEAAPQSMAGKL
ncbi:MAG: glutamyl-tRNA reductase [Lentimonas sp.]|jgi:glutamyl-tRNA reductase